MRHACMLPVEVRDGAPACPKPARTREGRVPQAVSACGALPRLRGGANVLLSVRGGRSRRASARGSHGRGVQGTRGGVDVRVDRGGGRPGSGSPLVGRLTDAARSAPACRRVSCLFAPRGAWHTAARASARRGVRPVEGAAGTHSVALRPRRVVHVSVYLHLMWLIAPERAITTCARVQYKVNARGHLFGCGSWDRTRKARCRDGMARSIHVPLNEPRASDDN